MSDPSGDPPSQLPDEDPLKEDDDAPPTQEEPPALTRPLFAGLLQTKNTPEHKPLTPSEKVSASLAGATVVVSIAALVVAYLTYRNASDTRQLSTAINTLASLAQETKREADNTANLLTPARASADAASHGLVANNRAWLDPVFANISLPALGKPLRLSISYINQGRSPATEIRWALHSGYFTTPPHDDGSLIKLPPNRTCIGLQPNPKGGTEFPPPQNVPPNMAGPHSYQGGPGPIADQALIEDKHRLYIQGCGAYRTLGIIGHSKFCFYSALDNGMYQIRQCAGNAAE